MTSFIKKVAGGLTMLEALWLLYAYLEAPTIITIGRTPFIPTYSLVALVVAIVAFADGAVGVWGVSLAYTAGALLSGAVLLITAFTVLIASGNAYPSVVSDDAMIGVAFALVALLVNVEAVRSRSGMSEQANPMNLPVFG